MTLNEKAILEKIMKCEGDIKTLNTTLAKIEAKRWADCLVSARMREEIDATANAKKEDRVIITGLTATSPPPVNFSERKKWFDSLVKALLDKVAGHGHAHVAKSDETHFLVKR